MVHWLGGVLAEGSAGALRRKVLQQEGASPRSLLPSAGEGQDEVRGRLEPTLAMQASAWGSRDQRGAARRCRRVRAALTQGSVRLAGLARSR